MLTAIADDNTSDEAKAHAREILDAYDQSGSTEYGVDEHEKRQLAGYKAALNSTLSLCGLA